MRGAKRQPVIPRFWKYVSKSDDCWLWTGAIDRGGYGRLTVTTDISKRSVSAHYLSWEIHFGPIPQRKPRLCVCHKCDVRHCVRPDHLFLGTDKDNVDDAFNKGRRLRDRRPLRPPRFTDQQVKEIRSLYSTHKTSCRALGKRFGASPIVINRIIRREIYRYIED
jgi:hypothetical protein